MPSAFFDRARLAALRGREQTLQRQIGLGYARGKYMGPQRAEQQKVRRAIRELENRLNGGSK